MGKYVMIAVALLVISGYGTKLIDKSVSGPRPHAALAQSPSGPHSMSLSSDRHGHFQVDANVDGRRIGFIVDTGASLVILRESDAALVGIHPTAKDYSAVVSTANGKIKAAPARLNRITVGDVTVQDINALVLPDAVLGQNLLGVSFLSRLKRYEYAQGRLVLEQ
jgi:aspartyl protease family protein